MSTIAESNLFQPIDGVMSESDKILGLMLDTPMGNTIMYADLDRVLGREFLVDRNPFYTARERLHKQHAERGTFLTIRNVGYMRSDKFTDTKNEAQKRGKRAKRQVTKGKTVLMATDRSNLTDEERKEITGLSENFARMEREVGMVSRLAQDAFDKAKKAQETANEALRASRDENSIRDIIRQELARQLSGDEN